MSLPATVIEARTNRAVWIVALLALVLRLMLLNARGDYLVYDEGYYLLLARSLRAGLGFTLNGLPHVALSPLQPVLVAALSFTGIPDLWASRLLAALCGALLVVPAASLAARWFGDRGARTTALLVAVHPALLTFLPFFPGQGWNLYFGSEPLYLLLALSALAAGIRAVYDEGWQWWIMAGVLGALAYLTRLEGIVFSAALGVAMVAALVKRGRLALWPRAVAAALAGAMVAAPYLYYLHGALGRWALSGRVQAAATTSVAESPSPTGPAPSGGSQAVNDFVWGGDTEVLWRTLYALDASGTRMASQYWGVARGVPAAAAASAASPADSAALRPPADSAAAAHSPPPRRSAILTLLRAILVVVPWWLIGLAAWGLARARPLSGASLWLAPLAVASLLPALLAYPEPRALLPLAPLSCILAAGACEYLRALLDRKAAPRLGVLAPTVVAMLLMWPTLRDFSRAWTQQTPLQQVSTARRVVGEYLAAHLAPGATVMSWHPAIAIWAHRDWRVLPYESFQRITMYAGAQHSEVMVFSRFEPSPLRDPPRAFTAVLVNGMTGFGANINVEPVDQTPNLFVGRLTDAIPARRP